MGVSLRFKPHDAISNHLAKIVKPIVERDVPYTVLHPNIPTNFEQLQKSWNKLKEERDTF